MSRFSMTAVFALLVAMAVLFVGCGGGGGGSVTPIETKPGVLTTKVVSSIDGRGIDNVVVRVVTSLGTVTATSRNGGLVELNVGTTATLADYFQVDTTGAGSTFPKTELITYNSGQTYDPEQVDMPKDILNGVKTGLGTITVKEVLDASAPPGSAYPYKDTVLIGRVVRRSTGVGVSGVRVTFGYTPAVTDTTGAKGYFALNLGRDTTVISKFASDPLNPTFSIDASGLTGLNSTMLVVYNDLSCTQSSIPVPTAVYSRDENSLGTISIVDNGGEGPPPPPIL